MPLAERSTAIGLVVFSSAKTRIKLTVSGTASSAPGNPQRVLQNAKASRTTNGLKLKALPIMRGSKKNATKICTIVSVIITEPAIDKVPNCAKLNKTGKMTPIIEPIYGI